MMMDDDTIPVPNCLEELIKADEIVEVLHRSKGWSVLSDLPFLQARSMEPMESL